MNKTVATAVAGFALLGISSNLAANDGVDRYTRSYPTTFHLFPEPSGPDSGYCFLPSDTPAGADGDPSFRWAREHAIAVVRLAARGTVEVLGPARHPMAIFDISAENGDTPIDWRHAGGPRGRHPGGSHDGGLNLDLGYYLTSTRGKVHDPDHAACTDHFRGQEDAHQCTGPVDRLDVPRETCFLTAMFRVNRDDFSGDLLEEVGIDLEVRKAVLDQARAWVSPGDGRCGASESVVGDMARTFTSDPFDGWAAYHHHHVHVRFRDIDTLGRHREAVERLLAAERAMDEGLLTAETSHPVLRSRGRSTRLERDVEVMLLGGGNVEAVRFRAGAGDWVSPDPSSPWPRAVLDVPSNPGAGAIPIQAEVKAGGARTVTINGRVRFPPLDHRLFASADPRAWRTTFTRDGARWTFALDVQQPARTYVTAVTFEVMKSSAETAFIEAPPPAFEASYTDPKPETPVRLIRAIVTLSGRMKVPVAVYVDPGEPGGR